MISTSKIRIKIHTRCEFAQREYNRFLEAAKGKSIISGYSAYKVWVHYRGEFLDTSDRITGKLPRHRPNLKR